MSYSRRFRWGVPYLLTDLKDSVFRDEPAVFIGKKDADMERPTLCAVCGEPLGSKDYCSFFLMGPNGRGIDMMIGNGCIRERIREEEMGTKEANPRATLIKITDRFPTSGRWYGTFLHHCIAKPYVRKKECAENWDESILRLPGVRYIMDTIDNLRNDGWNLDAEMVLDCGNVDLLAKHPDGRTVVFDWKSDRSFDNHEAYIDQVNKYMAELHAAGMSNITGYIVWIMNKTLEPVRYVESPVDSPVNESHHRSSSLPMKCSLTIDMDGGEGPRKKKMSEYSHHRLYGDEVSFFIPSFRPCMRGYDFKYLEASPYREGERSQFFNKDDVNEGFYLNFICTKKRHAFKMTAHWEKHRPFDCALYVRSKDENPGFIVHTKSKIDEEGNDYAEFAVSEINSHLRNKSICHAVLFDDELEDSALEWGPEDLKEGMTIHVPCIGDDPRFLIEIESISKPVEKNDRSNKMDEVAADDTSIAGSMEQNREHSTNYQGIESASGINGGVSAGHNCIPYNTLPSYLTPISDVDLAEYKFTPGRIYRSGSRFYGVYKREMSERYNTSAKVDIAEVDTHGRKISRLEWRYVYLTPSGKEFVFGIHDREWKVYTKDVLNNIPLEGMERFG